jgi:hypothetical protein
MNYRSIAKKLGRGELHYFLGRFALARAAYSALNGIVRPVDSAGRHGLQSIFTAVSIEGALARIRSDAVALGFDLPAPLVAELSAYAKAALCVCSHDEGAKVRWSDIRNGRLADGSRVAIAYVAQAGACAVVRQIMHDPVLLAVVSAYLGYSPRKMEPRLYWSFVNDLNDDERLRANQTIRYHFDVGGFNFIYANFYVTDVDRTSGAHAFIRASHRAKPLRMLWHSANQTDEAVREHFGRENEIIIEGPRGTGFVQDASCYHKALPPLTQDRLMLQIRYS